MVIYVCFYAGNGCCTVVGEVNYLCANRNDMSDVWKVSSISMCGIIRVES